MDPIEQENCQDEKDQKENNISILTVISAVCSGRPVEIGSSRAGEGERAAKMRAGGRHSHLSFAQKHNSNANRKDEMSFADCFAQKHNSDANRKDEKMSCHLLSGHQGRAA